MQGRWGRRRSASATRPTASPSAAAPSGSPTGSTTRSPASTRATARRSASRSRCRPTPTPSMRGAATSGSRARPRAASPGSTSGDSRLQQLALAAGGLAWLVDDAPGLRLARHGFEGDEIGRLERARDGREVEIAQADVVLAHAVQAAGADGPRVDHHGAKVAVDVLLVVVAGQDRHRPVVVAGGEDAAEVLGEAVLV